VGNFLGEQRPLIAHLPIRPNEISFDKTPSLMTYDPSVPDVPTPYEETHAEYAFLETKPELPSAPVLSTSEEPAAKETVPVKARTPSHYSEKLMVQYQESNRLHQLPTKTDIACFWCCETFASRPCVIPTVITDGVWSVYGNFCTPHCASAYILADILDTHVRWERLAHLHRLYGSNCGGRIYPSPKRECLERFGGPMKTQDFRKLCEDRKIRADVHLPPMVSILASMDTKPVDFYETSMRNVTSAYVPVANQDSGLKLKRSKPLKDRESTLDACLNIQIGL
jgi:hypothetical protein